jgi:hypothetical protein
MDINLDDDLFDDAIYYAILTMVQDKAQDRQQCWQTAMPGSVYVDELLNSGHPNRIRQVLRMQLGTFYALRDWLLANTHLKASKQMLVEEKLLMFLHLTTRPASNRDTQERFSHSGETISRYINSLFLYIYIYNLIVNIVAFMRFLMPLWSCILTLLPFLLATLLWPLEYSTM